MPRQLAAGHLNVRVIRLFISWREFDMDILWRDRKRTLFGLPLSFTKYELDEERLFVKTGFLDRKSVV